MTEETGDAIDAAEGAELPLDEALSIVGEETRALIVAELGDAADPADARPGVLAYAELMDRVGVEDSGRFNYHLGELTGTFVRKVDDGYRLRPSGHRFYRAMVAGTLTDRQPVDSFEAGRCPECDGVLTAESRGNHFLQVVCEDCGEFAHTFHLPNRAARARTPEETLDAAVRRTHHEVGLLRQGICYACSAPVECDLRTDDPGVCGRRCGYDVYAVYDCSECSVGGIGHPAHAAVTTPPAVGFFADHDREAVAIPPWSPIVVDAETESRVLETEPLAVEVPFELGDERLVVRLDDDLGDETVTRSATETA